MADELGVGGSQDNLRGRAMSERPTSLVGVLELFGYGHPGRRAVWLADLKLVVHDGERLATSRHVRERRQRGIL